MFSIYAIVAVIVMMTIGRHGYRLTTFAAGFLGMAAAFAVLSFGSSFGVAALGMAIFGLGFGMLYPTRNTQVAAMFPANGRGRAYGIFNAFYTMGVVVTPPAIGWAVPHTTTSVVFGVLAALALLGRGGAVRISPLDGRESREGPRPVRRRYEAGGTAGLMPEPTPDRPAASGDEPAEASVALTGTCRSSGERTSGCP